MSQRKFKAEVAEVLSLVVNSLYTHKEVFLRELISNASDAIDQLAFHALSNQELVADGSSYHIDLVADRDAKTLTISDDGIGMDQDELVTNLGTIAHSGTRKLLESLSGDQRKDLSLIGQFGVGFYSAFLVADEVTVVTKKAGGDGQAWKWSSDGKTGYTVEKAERASRGTDVILHIKDSEQDFLRDWTLRELVRKYSDFVRHPIRMQVEKGKGDAKTKEMEQVNRGAALWTRPKSDLTETAVNEFYKHSTRDWEPPLAWTHFRTEGAQELTALLFVPRHAMPFDQPSSRRRGVRLFVKRVFIMDDCEELLPEYLRFVKGVVDSDDLPLNVSREFLQRDRIATGIRKQVVRKVLDLLEQLAEEKPDAPEPAAKTGDDEDEPERIGDRYAHFWKQHGRVLSEGVTGDSDHKDRIVKLLRFQTSHGDELTGLDAYLKRMPEGQPAIYWVVAETRDAAARSPHTEALRKRGWEFLCLTEPIDEWVLSNVTEFEGKKLRSAGAGDLGLPEETAEKEEREKLQGTFAPLVERVKGALSSLTKDVRLSTRLTDSPACLVNDEDGTSPQLARLLRAHDRNFQPEKRILELNPGHPVIQRLNAIASDTASEGRVAELSTLLYDHALVAEGSAPSDPARFARQVTELLSRSL